MMEGKEANRVIDLPECDCIYIPSQSIDPEEIAKLVGFVFYEERPLFCSLLRLRAYPNARCVFVTSMEIKAQIVNYYLSLAADKEVSEDSIRSRFLLLTVNDGSALPLTEKIINNQDILTQIQAWIRPEHAYMRCIISTPLEERLAHILGIPLRANPSSLSCWGTKHGSRKVFKEANIPLPDGTEEAFSGSEFIDKVLELWERNPRHRKFVAKLNEGVSGEGNAVFYLQSEKLEPSTKEDLREYILNQLTNMEFVAECESWPSFENKIRKTGAIAELWIDGIGATSPSSQGFITDDGKVFVLSTHEQILNKSLYLGCHFPASPLYRKDIAAYCRKIGETLASHGAKERFGVDYVVVPVDKGNKESTYDIYGIEINLRSGGTTHPCETARLLCRGYYCGDQGTLIAHDGKPKYYQASDNVIDESFKCLSFENIIRVIEKSDCRWNEETLTGCIFYFLGALPNFGKVGMLALADSKDETLRLFRLANKTLFDACSAK